MALGMYSMLGTIGLDWMLFWKTTSKCLGNWGYLNSGQWLSTWIYLSIKLLFSEYPKHCSVKIFNVIAHNTWYKILSITWPHRSTTRFLSWSTPGASCSSSAAATAPSARPGSSGSPTTGSWPRNRVGSSGSRSGSRRCSTFRTSCVGWRWTTTSTSPWRSSFSWPQVTFVGSFRKLSLIWVPRLITDRHTHDLII